MKSREEFISDIFEKAEAARAKEAKEALRRKKRRKAAGAIAAAAACVMIAIGVGTLGEGGLLEGQQIQDTGESAQLYAANLTDGENPVQYGEAAGETNETGENNPADPAQTDSTSDKADSVKNAGSTGNTDSTDNSSSAGSQESSFSASGQEASKSIKGNSISEQSEWAELIDNGQLSEESEQNLELNKQMQEVSIRIFKQTASSEENSMISPISVIAAMGMVENGAAGNTKAEMEKAFGMSTEDMTEWLRAWSKAQKNKSQDGKTKINIANAFWYNRGAGFKPSTNYKKVLKDSFNAEIRSGKFDESTVNRINTWVDNQTDGMIKKLVNQLSPADVTVLVNAVAFQDKWAAPYEKNQVKKQYFTTESGKKKKMNMMYSTEDTYCHDKLATGFVKDYQSGYQFVAILPKEGVTVKEYLAQMDGDGFANFLDSTEEARVHAVLPSFKSEYTAENMVSALKKMGMTDVFSSADADLSGMGKASGQNLFVGDVLHKTYINVNRQGTKAAAVTGVIVKATSMMPQPLNEYTVRLNRPFIYAIIDVETKVPVFIGTMMGA